MNPLSALPKKRLPRSYDIHKLSIGIQICPLCAAGFGGSARIVGAGRDCGDETSAGCVISVAAFESPAIVTGLDDVTVMGQPVEQRGGHLGVAESASDPTHDTYLASHLSLRLTSTRKRKFRSALVEPLRLSRCPVTRSWPRSRML